MSFALLTNSTASNRLRARRSSSLRSGGANTTRPKLIDTAYHKLLYESRTYYTRLERRLYGLACELVGITHSLFCLWRRQDPDFAARIDAASARGDMARIKKNDGHGEQSWQSLAWLLERRRPLEYGRQAAQINVTANAGAVAG